MKDWERKGFELRRKLARATIARCRQESERKKIAVVGHPKGGQAAYLLAHPELLKGKEIKKITEEISLEMPQEENAIG